MSHVDNIDVSELVVIVDIDDEIDDYEDDVALFKTSHFGHLMVNSQMFSKMRE